VTGSAPTIVRTYKAAVTRAVIHQFGGAPGNWQRNYYEHVVQNDEELTRITQYIESNPDRWEFDEDNV
jgi:REP element-mobilizing transposase RayT